MIPVEVGKRFGVNLKRARKRRGISQDELAFTMGLHRTEASLLERGLRFPRIDTFVKLCDSLDAKPRELLRGIVWVRGDGSEPGAMRVIDDNAPPSAGEDSGAGR
ncbi:MAG: helix-turn-helix transcriptional regulator [Solirubrobacterales bacterium]|nr:helix-turn-helix transcriptional regulator [Solirubrobacterales bacterium]